MNPPFTANDKRGRKFSEEVTQQMQAHEISIRNGVARQDLDAGELISMNSVRTFFTPLADRLLKSQRGTLAKVLPVTACTGSDGRKERTFLADRFHIERVITTHDPKRINFSENTTIHESLLICRRRTDEKDRPTEFFSLNRMPSNASEAIACADEIAVGAASWGTHLLWPAERVRQGDWSPVQWYDGSLAEAARKIEHLDCLEPLDEHHAIGPSGRAAQDSWQRCEAGAPEAVRIFDSTSAEIRRRMYGEPEQWVAPGGRRKHLWRKVKAQSSNLLITTRLNTVSGRLTALSSDQSAFGFGWMPVEVFDIQESKALALWLNSTPARLMLLNRRAKTLTYPVWSVHHWKLIRIPKRLPDIFERLASTWELLKNEELLRMRDAEADPVRARIDEVAAKACGLDESLIRDWRERLSREPTITNMRAVTD